MFSKFKVPNKEIIKNSIGILSIFVLNIMFNNWQ